MTDAGTSTSAPVIRSTNWLAAALELIPLAAPPLLVAFGLGIAVAFAAGIGWAKIGRSDIGVAYAAVRGAVIGVVFIVLVYFVLAHDSGDRRSIVTFAVLAFVWRVPPLVSAATVVRWPARPDAAR